MYTYYALHKMHIVAVKNKRIVVTSFASPLFFIKLYIKGNYVAILCSKVHTEKNVTFYLLQSLAE